MRVLFESPAGPGYYWAALIGLVLVTLFYLALELRRMVRWNHYRVNTTWMTALDIGPWRLTMSVWKDIPKPWTEEF